MKFLFGVCCFGVPIIGTACAAEDVNEYRTALDTNYADYQIVNATDESQQQRRQSPDSFDNDILVGDFNFDSHSDFAAILSRNAADAELEQITADRKLLVNSVFLAVVCNGLGERQDGKDYHCTPLSDTVVGGFGSELDLIDLSQWGSLSDEQEAYGNMQCQDEMQSLASKKLLSLREPFGRCTTFYFPESDGSYGQCTYCAD